MFSRGGVLRRAVSAPYGLAMWVDCGGGPRGFLLFNLLSATGTSCVLSEDSGNFGKSSV